MSKFLTKDYLIKLFYPFSIFQLFLLLSFSEEPFRIKEEEVLVVSKIPSYLMIIGRHVTVIKKDEIEKFPVKSVPELLKYVCGLDFQERGNFGIQADLSLRGSSFQQVLILVDGVKVNDLQTAHHNMDIPVSIESIERIEILHGSGSSLYGADGVGGVINIVTKNPEGSSFSGKFGYYDFHTPSFSSGIEIKKDKISNSISIQRDYSKGFMDDREFSNFSFFEKFSFSSPSADFKILASHGRKNFGAFDFYTPGMNLPSLESTNTDFVSITIDGKIKKFFFTQRLFYRSHFDRFILNRNRPSLYINETTNRNFGTNFTLRTGNFVFGFEGVREGFESIIAGSHSNIRSALFFETRKEFLKKIIFNLGIREDFHQTYGWSFSPDFSFTFIISSKLKLRASAGRSFRAPSYTELYYKDPVNIGNPNLKPEEGTAYEIGFDSYSNNFEMKVSLFERNEEGIIDWIKRDKKWYAENLKRRNIRGIEIEAKRNFSHFQILLKSSFFDIEEKENYNIYKYGFRIPKNITNLSFSIKPSPSFFINFHFLYKKRFSEPSLLLIDAKLVKKIGGIEIFIEGTNLANERYEDIKGVPMPGRWLGGGIKWKI